MNEQIRERTMDVSRAHELEVCLANMRECRRQRDQAGYERWRRCAKRVESGKSWNDARKIIPAVVISGEVSPGDLARFWNHVVKGEGCWEWKRCKGNENYPAFSFKGKQIKANRFSWYAHNGPIPEGKQVCHSCDNRKCVRPDHLFLGTQKDNVIDMYTKGRRGVIVRREKRTLSEAKRGANNPAAKLTEDAVISIRKEYAENGVSYFDLASKHNVSPVTIRMIVFRYIWKHLP